MCFVTSAAKADPYGPECPALVSADEWHLPDMGGESDLENLISPAKEQNDRMLVDALRIAEAGLSTYHEGVDSST